MLDPPDRRVLVLGVRILDLEIPLRRARHLDDERERLAEERLDGVLLPELEEPQEEVALPPQARGVVDRHERPVVSITRVAVGKGPGGARLRRRSPEGGQSRRGPSDSTHRTRYQASSPYAHSFAGIGVPGTPATTRR